MDPGSVFPLLMLVHDNLRRRPENNSRDKTPWRETAYPLPFGYRHPGKCGRDENRDKEFPGERSPVTGSSGFPGLVPVIKEEQDECDKESTEGDESVRLGHNGIPELYNSPDRAKSTG